MVFIAMARATLTIDTKNPIFEHGFYATALVLRDDGECHTTSYENRFNRNLITRSRYVSIDIRFNQDDLIISIKEENI